MALVTRADLIAALLRLLEGERLHLLRRMTSPNKARVKITWQQQRDSIRNWYEIPQVQLRQNKLITGKEDESTFTYVARQFFTSNALSAVSLGCGTGSREIAWADTGRFKRIIGIDASEERIKDAKRKLLQSAFGNVIEFVAGDVLHYPLDPESYDVVIAEGILHHLTPLEHILDRILLCLKPKGLLIVNEYVGPNRFQWTKKQVHFCNALLSIIPEEIKTYRGTSIRKSRIFRPGTLSMLIYDPSEAVESSRIMEILQKKFTILERKDYGGTILHPLLKDISHHFVEMAPAKEKILHFLFEAEDYLLDIRAIESDFTFVIAQKA